MRGDTRATATPLSHVLAIAITAILVSGLLVGVSSFSDSQQQGAVRDQLETIGNRLADELDRVNRLAAGGATVNLTTRHPERVGGSDYTVDIVSNASPDNCESPLVPAGVDRCLELEAYNAGVTVYVPLNRSAGTTLSIESGPGGRFLLRSAATGTGPSASSSAPVTVSPRVGVAQNIRQNAFNATLEQLNRPPRPAFSIDPNPPRSDTPVTFNASASRDPGGTITDYEWDLDDDGSFEETGIEPPSRSYTPGQHNVSLKLTDDDGATVTLTERINVSGLEYQDDLQATDPDGDGDDTLTFTVENEWSRPIELSELYLDSDASGLDLRDEGGDDLDEAEVRVDVDDDGSVDAAVNYTSDRSVPDRGLITDLNGPGEDSVPAGDQTVPAGAEAVVTVGEFDDDLRGNGFDVGIDYVVDGTTNTSTFRAETAPVVSAYDVTAAGQTVTLAFESSRQLDDISVDIGGPGLSGSASLDEGDFSETPVGPDYEYEATVSTGTSGTFYAELTAAEAAGVSSPSPPLNDTAVAFDSAYVWDDAVDWDANQNETGVTHNATGVERDEDAIRLGYPDVDRGGDDLVGYWTFNEDSGDIVADVTGNGYDAERRGEGTTDSGNNTPVRGVTGMHGTSAWEFNTGPPSDEDAVYVDDNDGPLDGGDDLEITATAWVKADGGSLQNGQASIVGKQEGLSTGDWGIVVRESCPDPSACAGSPPYVGYYSEETGDYWLLQEVDFSSGWHHVGITADGTDNDVSVYVDGVEKQNDDAAPDGFTAESDHPVEIGRTEYQGDGRNYGFEGTIDNVRVYERELTDSEMADLYAAGTAGSFNTSVKSGRSLAPNDVELVWDGDVPSGTEVEVRLRSGSGSGFGSTTITSDSGTDASFSGASATDDYYLSVRLTSNSAGKSPTIDRLLLRQE